ncbi:hypothetical protein AB1Y20_005706 [Prymnesium parvum]|uniref:Major facilitator superfamily (MFS) profile domain-containing protein n=1 Tax=Prymnesium parvum TaxID=97485 RepID=A0AB34J0J5_PRYPA
MLRIPSVLLLAAFPPSHALRQPLLLPMRAAAISRGGIAACALDETSRAEGEGEGRRRAAEGEAERGAEVKEGRGPAGAMPAPSVSAAPALGVAAVLLAIFSLNQWARSLLFYLVDFGAPPTEAAARLFMNVAVGFDEAEYGVLASVGFSLLFSLTSLVAGGVVDRVEPRGLLALTVGVWSLALVWQGNARSFADVLGSRMLSGFAQAFNNPAAYTILSRTYPREQRATVNGIYSSGLYIGGGLAALSIVADNLLGWRELTTLVGGAGIVLAVVAQLSLPATSPLPPQTEEKRLLSLEGDSSSEAEEQPSSLTEAEEQPSVLAELRELLREPTVRWLLMASGLRFLAGFTIGVWVVPFYRGAFPEQIGSQFALLKAGVNGLAGSASAAAGGVLTDRLQSRDGRYAQWVPALGCCLAIPFWIGTIKSPTIELSLAFLFAEYLVAECWFGPTIASLQNIASPKTQGLTQGLFSMLTLFGNLAPALIGYLLSTTNAQLDDLLLVSVPVLYAASALLFFIAGESAALSTQSKESL